MQTTCAVNILAADYRARMDVGLAFISPRIMKSTWIPYNIERGLVNLNSNPDRGWPDYQPVKKAYVKYVVKEIAPASSSISSSSAENAFGQAHGWIKEACTN